MPQHHPRRQHADRHPRPPRENPFLLTAATTGFPLFLTMTTTIHFVPIFDLQTQK
jgi:hypothetical protein